jgi:hypothetical protein
MPARIDANIPMDNLDRSISNEYDLSLAAMA